MTRLCDIEYIVLYEFIMNWIPLFIIFLNIKRKQWCWQRYLDHTYTVYQYMNSFGSSWFYSLVVSCAHWASRYLCQHLKIVGKHL